MYEAYVWGNENVLELDMYVVTQQCNVLNTTELFKCSVFYYVNFTSMKKNTIQYMYKAIEETLYQRVNSNKIMKKCSTPLLDKNM